MGSIACDITTMMPKVHKILVINPNTTKSITESFKPIVLSLNLPNTSITYWTSPSGSAIIRTQEDIYQSAIICIKPLLEIAPSYDGFLVACYADHVLIPLLKSNVAHKPVIGIFDASIMTALHLAAPSSKFAILTTGKNFEPLLTEGVKHLLGIGVGAPSSELFGGVLATGVSVDELSTESQKIAKAKVIDGTRRLVSSGDISVICLGGVILSGTENWVREGCVLELGKEKGEAIRVIDQILAGIVTLHGLVCLYTEIIVGRQV